jgi:hypothetical protein
MGDDIKTDLKGMVSKTVDTVQVSDSRTRFVFL